MSTKTDLTIGDHKVTVSNLEKILYPAVGFTKGEVIDYYIRIAPVLLAHLEGRPLTLKRYPEGVNGFFFYEKQCPKHRPDWVETTQVTSQRKAGHIDYCLMNNLPALIWVANLADLELHTFLHKAPKHERPNFVAFDLDPGAPADIQLCCQVALWLKELLDGWGLRAFPKTSGSKGLQIYLPLNTPLMTYEKTKPFAQAIAQRLEREHPDKVVSRMLKSLRLNKVLVDWSQNDEHKTTICVYSLRAKEEPTASTPVTWEEVAKCAKGKIKLRFHCRETLERVSKMGDLFEPVLKLKQKLPKLQAIE